MGTARIPSSGYGRVNLKVNGDTKVQSYVNPDADRDGYYPLSLNILQQLEAGDTVTIEWAKNGDAYFTNYYDVTTHWTGTYMGYGTPALP